MHAPSIKRAKKRLNNDNATNQSPSFRRGLGGGPDNNHPKPASNTTDRQLNVSNQRGGWLQRTNYTHAIMNSSTLDGISLPSSPNH